MPAWLSTSKPIGPPGLDPQGPRDPQAAPKIFKASSFKRVDSVKANESPALARKSSMLRSGRYTKLQGTGLSQD